jgi:hypothetical protein
MHRDVAVPSGNVLIAFFAGGLLGVMSALLLAPQTGGRTRSRIVEQIRDGLRSGKKERARGRLRRGRPRDPERRDDHAVVPPNGAADPGPGAP